MTPRDRRPEEEQGPVDWGTGRSAGQARPGRSRVDVGTGGAWRGGGSQAGRAGNAESAGAAGSARTASGPTVGDTDDPGRSDKPGGPDWGVGRGPAPHEPTPGQRARTPWPASVRRQRLAGVVFALVGLVTATFSAMNLAENAEAGRLWVPPWLVAVLGGAGLVAAAGYLAWAGGAPVRHEEQRWQPRLLDAAAGLTAGRVQVADPARLLAGSGSGQGDSGDAYLDGVDGRPDGRAGTGRGAEPGGTAGGVPGQPDRAAEGSPPLRVSVNSAPRPIMGASTVEQSVHAPAGVAGAVGGFMMAAAVVCAVLALVLGPSWLIATAALSLGGLVSVRLAGDWLGVV
ncbi:PsbA protein [Actinomyces sp. 2119]|uniref:PsbA protein n=1 Tax=Actinomyces sp. 2119 TaxID=2321393 RepID=UPI002175B986|nr:PsbA protein [Actinomyces sp. 2119]